MAYDKPLPYVTALARPFWQGTHEHELRLQRCAPVASFSFHRKCCVVAVSPKNTTGRRRAAGRRSTASWCSIGRRLRPSPTTCPT